MYPRMQVFFSLSIHRCTKGCGARRKNAAAHPRMERRQAAQPGGILCSQAAPPSFLPPPGNRPDREAPAASLSGKAADILALCFHALLECARQLQKQQIVIIKQIFLFSDLLSSKIEADTVARHARKKIMRPDGCFVFFPACAGNPEGIFQKIRPPLGCPHQRCLMTPRFDLFVIAGKQHFRDFFIVPCLRPCIMRVLKQVILQRLKLRRLLVA